MVNYIKISEVEDRTRLSRWFIRHYPGMPLKDFYKLCRGGQIRLNSSRCKGTEVLLSGDMVRIPPTMQSYTKVIKSESGNRFSLSDLEQLRKTIIYNDNDIVVFNKPAGLAVQGGTSIKQSIDKMASALFPYNKISLVHRLDRETSGLLVVAKNQKSAQSLAKQFQTKDAHKEYLALLQGNIKIKSGIIDNYVIKGDVIENIDDIPKGVKPQRAITKYNVIGEIPGLSWVLFVPKTGRTHQLRLHSAYSLNAPIVGDELYGVRDSKFDKQFGNLLEHKKLFLFAYKLTFTHPTKGNLVTLCAIMPDFMQNMTKFLEFNIPQGNK